MPFAKNRADFFFPAIGRTFHTSGVARVRGVQEPGDVPVLGVTYSARHCPSRYGRFLTRRHRQPGTRHAWAFATCWPNPENDCQQTLGKLGIVVHVEFRNRPSARPGVVIRLRP